MASREAVKFGREESAAQCIPPADVQYSALHTAVEYGRSTGYEDKVRAATHVTQTATSFLSRPRCCADADGQQGFATGATRNSAEGKVDFEGHLNPDVLAVFSDYMHAHRVQRNGRLRASDNWQLGIPMHCYVKSLIRHTFEFWRMWRGVPVVNPDSGAAFTFREVTCAIMFNVMGIIFEARTRHPGLLDDSSIPDWMRQQWEGAGADVEPPSIPYDIENESGPPSPSRNASAKPECE